MNTFQSNWRMCKYQLNGLKLPSNSVLLPERELKELKLLSFLATGTSENHLFLLRMRPTLKNEGVTTLESVLLKSLWQASWEKVLAILKKNCIF